MTIYKGSRYEYSTIDFVSKTINGQANPIVFYYFTLLGNVTYIEHTYIKGERLDQIAFTYYKDPTFWWIIPEFNPQVTDFTAIPVGTVLKIPNV
jgi:hypothetical protein